MVIDRIYHGRICTKNRQRSNANPDHSTRILQHLQLFQHVCFEESGPLYCATLKQARFVHSNSPKLTWNPTMKVWKMTFPFKRGDFQVPAVSFPGRRCKISKSNIPRKSSGTYHPGNPLYPTPKKRSP